MMNEKGLSNIVATISLVLITMVALGMVAGVIINLVRSNIESTECVEFRNYFSFNKEFGYNCYKKIGSSESLYAFSVESGTAGKNSESEAVGFKISFLNKDQGESETFDVTSGKIVDYEKIRMLNSSIINFQVPKSGEVKTYVLNSSKRFDSMEIYPKLSSGRLCEKTDDIEIFLCEPGKVLNYE